MCQSRQQEVLLAYTHICALVRAHTRTQLAMATMKHVSRALLSSSSEEGGLEGGGGDGAG